MIALAQLPDGSGINPLIQIASGENNASSGARTAALQMLAQVDSQSPDARAALLEQARQNKLSTFDWASLLPFLAGNQTVYQNSAFGTRPGALNPNDIKSVNIPASGQQFVTAPLGAMTPAQIAQQQALIDQLLAVTTDPVGLQTLQRAKALLANRLTQLASSSGQ
jgi:RecA/RadA recombinase